VRQPGRNLGDNDDTTRQLSGRPVAPSCRAIARSATAEANAKAGPITPARQPGMNAAHRARRAFFEPKNTS